MDSNSPASRQGHCRLSKHCKVEAFRKEMLRDRLVCGVASGAIQRRLLAEAEGLTLQKALNIARAMEAADANLQTLQDSQHAQAMDRQADVHTIAQPARLERGGPTRTAGLPCMRCGRKDHVPDECRFKSPICYTCRKLGHLVSVPLGATGYRPTLAKQPPTGHPPTFNVTTNKRPRRHH